MRKIRSFILIFDTVFLLSYITFILVHLISENEVCKDNLPFLFISTFSQLLILNGILFIATSDAEGSRNTSGFAILNQIVLGGLIGALVVASTASSSIACWRENEMYRVHFVLGMILPGISGSILSVMIVCGVILGLFTIGSFIFTSIFDCIKPPTAPLQMMQQFPPPQGHFQLPVREEQPAAEVVSIPYEMFTVNQK